MIVVQTRTSALAVHEAAHHLLQLVLVHLAVADDDARPRARGPAGSAWTSPMVSTRLCTKNTWPAALQLAPDGVADELVVELQ